MKLTCADPACERPRVRQRAGDWWCSWHPAEQPPSLDLVSGKLRDPKDPKKVKPVVVEKPAPYRAPGRVVEQPAPADGLCPVEGCTREWKHRGRHVQPKPAKAPTVRRTPRPAPPPPAAVAAAYDDAADLATSLPDVPDLTTEPAAAPTGPVLDGPEIARRYLGGERLFDLAASLHIGVARLRRILHEQDVTIRKRGQVIGTRGVGARPFDPDEAARLYATGLSTLDVGKQLGVRATRVADVLRERGLLRPPAHVSSTPGELTDIRVVLTGEQCQAARARAEELEVPLSHYVRELIAADLDKAAS